jgi:hypothetical protein
MSSKSEGSSPAGPIAAGALVITCVGSGSGRTGSMISGSGSGSAT